MVSSEYYNPPNATDQHSHYPISQMTSPGLHINFLFSAEIVIDQVWPLLAPT